MAPVAGIPPNIQNFTGPLFLAVVLAAILYGINLLQVYTYYLAFPKDRMRVKALVYTLFLLATTHTVISINDSFKMFGSGFGDMGALKATALSGLGGPILISLSSLIVQSFYLYQVRVISRSWVIPALILFVAMAQFIAAIISGVNFIFLGTLQAKALAMIWNFGSALCDTIIAIAMTFYNLKLLRAGSGLTNQNPIITHLVHLVIETGSLTALVAITQAILFISAPGYPYFYLPAMCLARLHSNSLMVILNSRRFGSIHIAGNPAVNTGSQHMRVSLEALGEISSLSTVPQLGLTPHLLVLQGDMKIGEQKESQSEVSLARKKVRRLSANFLGTGN
ncbi:hypothetical protein L218DRAFT_948295 [Marasmius fiardii PR-910]|nr:hypothetical protein L218DRAFT_948295 [Marasmius fiardii PR-910]